MVTYRSILEVLKWTDPPTSLRSSAVSLVWSQVCVSQELWYSYLDSLNIQSEEVGFRCPAAKDTYRVILTSRRLAESCVVATDDQLTLYSCPEQRAVRTFERNMTGYASTVILLLPNSTAFFCGGGSAYCHTYSLLTGEFLFKPDMRHHRSYHSAVHLPTSIYVFGGVERRCAHTAEVFNMTTWSPLPDMSSGRSHFNACVKEKLVYLIGGNTPYCEVFNADTATYSPLRYYLNTSTCVKSFLSNHCLITLTPKVIYYHQDNATKEQILRKPIPKYVFKSCGMQIIVVGKEAFIPVFGTNQVGKFNIEKLDYEKIEVGLNRERRKIG